MSGKATPFGKERAREIWDKRGAQYDLSNSGMTPGEEEFVREVWDANAFDGSSWISTFLDILNDRINIHVPRPVYPHSLSQGKLADIVCQLQRALFKVDGVDGVWDRQKLLRPLDRCPHCKRDTEFDTTRVCESCDKGSCDEAERPLRKILELACDMGIAPPTRSS